MTGEQPAEPYVANAPPVRRSVGHEEKMKYFTKEWWRGVDDPSAAGKEYFAYINTIREKLPKDLARLLDEISLHDSRVASFQFKQKQGLAILILNGSSDPWCRSKEPDRARRFTLQYTGVSDVTKKNGDGAPVTKPDDSDLGYDEIEILPNGMFQHRMLFASDIELHITFRDVSIEFKDEEEAQPSSACDSKPAVLNA